jgi:hypothetical protein
VILAMGTEGYFNWISKRMYEAAPAYASDSPMLAKMARISLVPCQPFELGKLDPAIQGTLKNLPATTLKTIEENQPALARRPTVGAPTFRLMRSIPTPRWMRGVKLSTAPIATHSSFQFVACHFP